MKQPEWSVHKERSNPLMLSMLCWIALHLGRFWARLILYPTAFYFLLTAPTARRASRDFLTRGLDRPVSLATSFHHFFTFGQVSVDRLFFLANRTEQFDIQVENGELFDRFIAAQRGGILISSHLGSFEVMRVMALRNKGLAVRILIHRQHNAMAMGLLEKLAPEIAGKAIDAGLPGPDIVLKIDQAVKQGEWIGIMADRASPEEAQVACHFLNGEANFPTGPWLLAATLKVPVVLCFGIYQGGNRYRLVFELFNECLEIPRPQRAALLQQTVQAYANRLAQQARRSPDNWFNFYDFWRH